MTHVKLNLYYIACVEGRESEITVFWFMKTLKYKKIGMYCTNFKSCANEYESKRLRFLPYNS